MVGEGLSFPVSEAVTGELYSAGNWADANLVASDEHALHRRLVGGDTVPIGPGNNTEVQHHHSSFASMV